MYRQSSFLLFAFLVAAMFVLPARADAEEVIRVRILENVSPAAIVVTSPAGDVDVFAGDFQQPISTLSKGDQARISQASGQLSIVVDGVRLFAEELRLRGASTLLIRVDGDGGNDIERLLPGELRVRPGVGSRLTLENVLDVEAYVASVVSHEYGFDDLEGSKAMAVVARTYALKQMQDPSRPLSDHIGSQVYGDQRRVTDVARRAAEETQGEILTYDGELIEAVYSSSSGGQTASNEDVWQSRPLPYLRSRNDPFDVESPHRQWTSRVDRDDLLRALSRELGYTVSGFIAGDRGPDNRVHTVELLRTSGPRQEISANRFRLIVNRAFGVNSLKSTNFDARRDGDDYVFSGSGFGHGVGMNQHGARYLATRGYSYRDILGFYYTGVRLASHRGGVPTGTGMALEPDPVLLADAGVPPRRSTNEERVQDEAVVADRGEVDTRDPREERVTSRTPAAPETRRPVTQKTGRRIGW